MRGVLLQREGDPPPGVEPMSVEWFDRRSLEAKARFANGSEFESNSVAVKTAGALLANIPPSATTCT